MSRKQLLHLSLCLLVSIMVAGCGNPFHKFQKQDESGENLASIIRRGKIIAVVDCNSTDYFIYKGVPMGFQFELLQRFADYIGVRVEI